MDDVATERVRTLYGGEAGRRWRRIEDELPHGYLEHNMVIGRRQLHDRLVEWLRAEQPARLLDAGCGLGRLAVRLTALGIDVTAVDLVRGFIESAQSAETKVGARFVVGDFVETLRSASPFDAVVLTEVLEDYRPSERFQLLRHVADSGARRLLLGFRTVEDEGGWLWERIRGDVFPGIEAIELLRWIHLTTPLRQRQQFVVRVRNYRVQLSDLVREG